MTVRQLVEQLSKMPPDAVCVVPGSDHSYESYVRPRLVKAERNKDGDLYEHYEEYADDDCDVVQAVVLY